jgi:hypothetical protein
MVRDEIDEAVAEREGGGDQLSGYRTMNGAA